MERIWRREGLKVPQKQKPRGRLWLNDGSCVRLRPERRNHVWSYDFVSARTHDGRSVRLLNLIDEHTREGLLVRAERRWSSARVISALADVMVLKGVPEHLRSDNGPEFVAKDLRKWLAKTGAKTLYIEPGSPWENGYCESFNSKLRDEFLNGEIFYSMKELRVLSERWRVHYNTIRPHSSLGYRSPAPEAWLTNTTGAWRGGNRYALPTSPHPRRRLSEPRNSCATLTLPTAQKIGHASNGWHHRSGNRYCCENAAASMPDSAFLRASGDRRPVAGCKAEGHRFDILAKPVHPTELLARLKTVDQ